MSDECDEMRTRVVGWLLGKEVVRTLLWGEARTMTDDGRGGEGGSCTIPKLVMGVLGEGKTLVSKWCLE